MSLDYGGAREMSGTQLKLSEVSSLSGRNTLDPNGGNRGALTWYSEQVDQRF